METMDMVTLLQKHAAKRSRELLIAIEALSKNNFAIREASVTDSGNLLIHCIYLGNSESLKCEPVTK